MRVALVSPTWFPVPPRRYGGIEAVVHLLADGLVDAGLDVTLFASGDSKTKAELVSTFEIAPSNHIGKSQWELAHLLPVLENRDRYDLVHDHSGLLGLTTIGLAGCPTLHTVHGPLSGDPGHLYQRICSLLPNATLVSLTDSQRQPQPHLPWIATINNAIDTSRYQAERHPGDSLLFLGRMSPDKGAHRAIHIAQQLDRPLKIAAKCSQPDEIAYFNQRIAPHLNDQIEYLGEVDHHEKCQLLAEAHALLMPIDWEEPFGLVIIEALASGTPVIATRRGSVPELLRHLETGYIADNLNDMLTGVEQVATLNPQTLRNEAQQRFSAPRMVSSYLATYDAIPTHKPTLQTVAA